MSYFWLVIQEKDLVAAEKNTWDGTAVGNVFIYKDVDGTDEPPISDDEGIYQIHVVVDAMTGVMSEVRDEPQD